MNDKKFDLEERTSRFGEMVIDFLQTLRKDEINRPLISQVVRSATSVGANYVEADGAVSKKDFRHKIGLCRKEARETRYWFRIILKANPDKEAECKKLGQEAYELSLIFSKIFNSTI